MVQQQENRTSSTSSNRKYHFLLHCFTATGHVLPMQAIASTLVRRGHQVTWLCSMAQKSKVIASGSTFVATQDIALVDDALLNAKPSNIVETVEALFGDRVEAQVTDFRRILKNSDARYDCLLIDALSAGAAALVELGEIPVYATLGVIPMYANEELNTVKPVPKPISVLGMILSQPEFTLPCINPQRVSLGLNPLKFSAHIHYSPYLHIQASCAALEFDVDLKISKTPAYYIGPLISRTKEEGEADSVLWWPEVESVFADPNKTVVGITQGTFAVDPSLLLLPAIEALSPNQNMLLVVPSPHVKDIRRMLESKTDETNFQFSNVRLAEWLPYDMLLPKCDILITNGGYGSVTQALSHGVPLICAGTTEDKKDTAARVTYVGAGIDLASDTPSKEQIRDSVNHMLEEPSYRANARRIAGELNSLGGTLQACDLLEEFLASDED